jgi:hypothetical protein
VEFYCGTAKLERLIALFLLQQAESAYSSATRILPGPERAESLQETSTEIRCGCGTTSLFSEQAIFFFVYFTASSLGFFYKIFSF